WDGPGGHVIRGVAVRVTAGEDQLGEAEDLQVTRDPVVLAEADQLRDVRGVADDGVRSIDVADLLLERRIFEQRREARIDEVGIERAAQVDVLVAEGERKGAKELAQRARYRVLEQRFERFDVGAEAAEPGMEMADERAAVR